jgi:hypothetical protein
MSEHVEHAELYWLAVFLQKWLIITMQFYRMFYHKIYYYILLSYRAPNTSSM